MRSSPVGRDCKGLPSPATVAPWRMPTFGLSATKLRNSITFGDDLTLAVARKIVAGDKDAAESVEAVFATTGDA